MARLRVGLFALLIAAILLLNLMTFVLAIPETTRVDAGCCASTGSPLAKDFSAYYVGAWRLIHDPAQVYTKGSVPDGGPQILPRPQQYKYLPSFLVLVLPFLVSSYQPMLEAFDVFQFLLLPVVALMVYRITKDKGLLASSVVAAVVLLQPSPLPGWGASATYYWQWGEGQAKVLLTFLLVLGIYFAKFNRPRLAGIACALASFDPRFVALAIPLLYAYTKGSRTKVAVAYAVTLASLNIPMLLPGVASGFLQMLASGGALTPPYYYSWIPILTAVSLTAADWRLVLSAFGVGGTSEHNLGRVHERVGGGVGQGG